MSNMLQAMRREHFEMLLVKPPALQTQNEAVAFDRQTLAKRPDTRCLLRPAQPFDLPPGALAELSCGGDQVFVAVEPRTEGVLSLGAFTISAAALRSRETVLPLRLHYVAHVIYDPQSGCVTGVNPLYCS